jgi:UDP-N-acetylmuramate dehydrogenase
MDYYDSDTCNLSALRIGYGRTKVATVASRNQLKEVNDLFKSGERIHVLGEGTNSVFGSYDGTMIKLGLFGHSWDGNQLTIAGGEKWQQAVDLSIERGLCGIERLTQIPGTVGAAPVQNIGAFGQILSDRIVNIEVYDYATNALISVTADDCGFGDHRESKFKSSEWSTYVIIGITLALLDKSKFTSPYGEGLMGYGQEHSMPHTTVMESEKLITKFRSTLYPDYLSIPNCGSYFTNYEVIKLEADKLPVSIWNIKHREIRNGHAVMFQCKDLLSSVGINAGHKFSGGLMMHPKLNNFLINPDMQAVPEDLLSCHSEVNTRLMNAYGIQLTPEPEFIDSTVR